MTREDLVKMVGNEDQANYAIDFILGNITGEFVKNVLKVELKKVETEIKALVEEDVIYKQ